MAAIAAEAVEQDPRAQTDDRPILPQNRARKRILLLIFLVWVITAALFMLPYLVSQNSLDPPTIISHFGVALVAMAFSVGLLIAIVRLRQMSERLTFIGSALAVVFSSALIAVSDIALFDFIHGLYGREHAPQASYLTKWTSNFAIFMSQFSVIAIAFWMLETLEDNRAHQLEIEQVRRLAAEAQNTANRAKLSALRYQLNPHFLFNTLNSISSLVITRRNPDAERMLTRLAEFLRTTLSGDPDTPQTLEGELETIEAYLAIERIRFGDRLAVEIDCPSELRDATMPHFLLQPLVENAVKHGVAPSDELVTIRIAARTCEDELTISVENDSVGDAALEQGTRVGLRNVRERLAAVYGERGHLESMEREAGYLALVRFPLEWSN